MRRERILVITRGHLGDLIGALPALRDLRAAKPDAHIAVMLNEYLQGALDDCSFVDECIYAFAYRADTPWRRLARLCRTALRVLGRFDIAILLRMAPSSGPLLALLSGSRLRVGYNQDGYVRKLLTHNLGPQPIYINNRKCNLTPLLALGIPTAPALPRIDWISASVRRRVDWLLMKTGVELHRPFAVLQISSHWGCNEWHSEKWAEIADHLVEFYGLRVVITGTGEEFELAKYEDVRRRMRTEPVSLHGRTSIAELIEVVGRASVVLACDSALTQISLAQGVPSVILFGEEPLVRNGPLPEECGLLLEPIQHWEGPDSAPPPNPHCRYGASSCHGQFCCENSSLRQISVDEVKVRVQRLMAARGVPMERSGAETCGERECDQGLREDPARAARLSSSCGGRVGF